MNKCLQISKFESITLELWQFNNDYEVHLNIPGNRIEMMTVCFMLLIRERFLPKLVDLTRT